MSENMTYVPSRLTSAKPDKTIAGANEILDDDIHLKQNAINNLTKKVVTLNAAPTSSTLTYTVGNVTCNFAIGDEVRIEDSSQGNAGTNSYIYYKLFDIDNGVAYWDLLNPNDDCGSSYVPTLEYVPTSSTTTYVKDGETIAFEIGQFARVPNENSYDFYQLYDIRNNGTEALWAGISALTPPEYEAPLAKTSLVYNGNAQELLIAGSTNDGTITYSSDNGETWVTEIPKATNAGSYTVYWRLVGDNSHSNIPKTAITVTIAKANGSVTTAPAGGTKTYTGSSIALVSAGSGTGTMMYKLGTNGNFSTSIPTAKDIGNYTIYYKTSESDNYTESSVGSVTTKIDYNYNGHAYVDLGLPSGTKWSTMYVGASNSTSRGSYYRYGYGTTTYSNSQSNYSGTENPLSLSKDTARQAWGGHWHMPTKEQIEELLNNVTFTGANENGNWVVRGVSKINGASIVFFPNGYYINGQQYYNTTECDMLSCTPINNSDSYALQLKSYYKLFSFGRNIGTNVRPVIG